MPVYYITSSNTTPAPHDSGFTSIVEARKELVACVDEDLAEARKKWKTAAKIRISANAYAIHATRDRQSALWRSWTIVPG